MGQGSRAETPGEGRPTPAELEAVGLAVEQALSGVTVLDRGIELDDGARADLAGVDETGRLVLVHLAGPEPDRAALAVLDLVVGARAHGELIARHLGSARIVSRLEPRVVIVLDASDQRLLARISAITGPGLELLELRSVKSFSAERSYLIPRRRGGGAAGEAVSLQRFLDALPPERETLGRNLCARLARLDDELRTEASSEEVAWFFQDRELVRLESRGGRLLGSVGRRGAARDLEAASDADQLLEEALTQLVEDLDRGARAARAPEAAEPADGTEPHDPGVGLALLTAEEIQAFRD